MALTSVPSRPPALGDHDKPKNVSTRDEWGVWRGRTSARRHPLPLLSPLRAPPPPVSPSLPTHTADGHLRTFLPKPASCWFRAKCAAFPPGSVRKWPGLDSSRLVCFPNKASALLKEPQQCPFFQGACPSPPPSPGSGNTSPSVCKASASCLTSLIY